MSTANTYEINLSVTGLCPLILVKGGADTNNPNAFEASAFGLVEHKRHLTSFKVNGAEVRSWVYGKVILTVYDKDNHEKTGLRTCKNDNQDTGEMAFSNLPDLESNDFHNKKLDRYYKNLKGHLELKHGDIFTKNLSNYEIEFHRRGQIVSKKKIADTICVKIPMNFGDYAHLDFTDQKLRLVLKDANYDLELDNSCPGHSQACLHNNEENDFSLVYRIVELEADDPPFVAKIADIGPMQDNHVQFVKPLICSPVVFGQSENLPNPNYSE